MGPGGHGSRLPRVQVTRGSGSRCPGVRSRVPGARSSTRCQIRVPAPECQISARSDRLARVMGLGTGNIDRITGYPGFCTKERGFSPGSRHRCQTKSSPGRGHLALEPRTLSGPARLFPVFDRPGLLSLNINNPAGLLIMSIRPGY